MRVALTSVGLAIATGWLLVVLAAQAPAFDAASVKENNSGALDGVFSVVPGRLGATNLSLESIIRFAYGIREYQLLNAPSWTKRRYDLAATFAPRDAPQDQVRLMLQRLLAERVGLRVHREERPLRVYALTQASPGVLGPKLVPSTQTECAVAPLAAPQCRRYMTPFFIKGIYSMPQLARSLEQVLDLPVADRSNLTGVYDIDLQWGTGNISDPIATLGVNEQTALRGLLGEQLGLKLDVTRAPYEMIVVDAISTLTPD